MVSMKKELERLIRPLIEKYEPQEIVLFGSYAYGNPTRDSDLDLLIVKETSESPFMRRVTVSRICEDLHRRIPFQPLVVTPTEIRQRLELGDPFFKEIHEKGLILYRSDG